MLGLALLCAACTTPGSTPAPSTTTAGSPASGSSGATSTPSGTSAVSITTTLPYPTDVPAAARTHDASGAQEFVKYYWSQVNLAWTRPQAGLISPLCLPTSKSCAIAEEAATRLVAENLHYDRVPTTSLSAVALTDPDGKTFVIFSGRQEHCTIIDSSGSVSQVVDQQAIHADFAVTWSSHGWLIETIKVIQ